MRFVSFRSFTFIGALASCGVAGAALAADGLDFSPLACGSGDVHGLTCQIRPLASDKYRPVDARVEKIRRNGYAASGYFLSVTTPLTPSQAAALTSKTAGTQIVIKNGTYTSFSGVFQQMSGTEANPILIRPETPGGVVFVGQTSLKFHGENIIVDDLKIKNGTFSDGQSAIYLGDSGAGGACNHCVAMNLYVSNLSSTGSVHYLSMRGEDSTVAFSTFRDAGSLGHFIAVPQAMASGAPSRPHILHNVFYNRTAATDVNGYELLQLGESAVQAQSAYGRVEENLFENATVPNQDTELVTIKSSDWIVRNNTFKNNVGALTLRSANR